MPPAVHISVRGLLWCPTWALSLGTKQTKEVIEQNSAFKAVELQSDLHRATNECIWECINPLLGWQLRVVPFMNSCRPPDTLLCASL